MRLVEYFATPGSKTQAQIAKEVGRSRSYISRVTNGDLMPALKPAADICKATDGLVTMQELLPVAKEPAASHVASVGDLVVDREVA